MTTLFCPIHFPLVPLKQREAIASNRELPIAADSTTKRTHASAVRNAVDLLAKKEGKAEQLRQSTNAQRIDPADVPNAQTGDRTVTTAGGRTLGDTYVRIP